MRKLLIQLLFPLFVVNTNYGQNGLRIDTLNYKIDFTVVDNETNGIQLQLLTELEKELSFHKTLSSVRPEIEEADLVLNSLLKPVKKKQWYVSQITLEDYRGNLFRPSSNNFINNFSTTKRKSIINTLSWKNTVENILLPNQRYTINYQVLRIERLVDCAKPLSSTLKTTLPYLGGALIGLGVILQGQKTKSNATANFNKSMEASDAYLILWENGSELNEAELVKRHTLVLLDRANDLNIKQRNLTIAGINIIAISAVSYIFHRIIYNKNYKLYKQFCEIKNQSKLNLKPVINFSSIKQNQQVGFSLAYTF